MTGGPDDRYWLKEKEGVPRRFALRRLKRTVAIEAVLAHYGLDRGLRSTRHERVGACPLPNHGGDRSNRTAFRVHMERNVWRCLTHCGGGDIVALTALLEGNDDARAARALAALEHRFPSRVPMLEAQVSAGHTFVPYTQRLRLHVHHPYLQKRGILPGTARAFESGWWPINGLMRGCVAVRLPSASATQLMRLNTATRVILMLDGNDVGQAANQELARVLGRDRVCERRLPYGRDPADLNDSELRHLVGKEAAM